MTSRNSQERSLHIRSGTETVALVEGVSDRKALLGLANRLGRDLERERVEIIAMGGATKVGAAVAHLELQCDTLAIVGLCDEKEIRFFERVLDPDDIFVCAPDLEGEFIAAVGNDDMIRFIEAQGELKAFRIFQKQPAQRSRTIEEQLHRFCGTLGGRNIRYAEAMVDWLTIDAMPQPLTALLDAV